MLGRILQVATLLNAITHLLAGSKTHRSVLAALPKAFQVRLTAAADSEQEFNPLCAMIDASFDQLLAYRPSTSASAKQTYLSCALKRSISASCGLLFCIASAAHCEGSCSEKHAKAMRLTSLPCVGSLHDVSTAPLMRERMRALATRVVSRPNGPGSGAVGCKCRAALCAQLLGSMPWPGELLQNRPSALPHNLAAQGVQCPGRRCVVAQLSPATGVASIDQNFSRSTGLHITTAMSEDEQHRGLNLHVAAANTPARLRWAVGCVRNSSLALASLVVAAQAWVHGKDRWNATYSRSGSLLFCGTDTADQTFTAEKGNWGYAEVLESETLKGLGYLTPTTDDLLVYAVVEFLAVEG